MDDSHHHQAHTIVAWENLVYLQKTKATIYRSVENINLQRLQVGKCVHLHWKNNQTVEKQKHLAYVVSTHIAVQYIPNTIFNE